MTDTPLNMNGSKQKRKHMINAKTFYYDWWNNYLTTDRIAFDYGITQARAVELINQGRIEWNRDADKAKGEANA